MEKDYSSIFAPKDWNEIRINDSWAIWKISSEFVQGYEMMSKIGPCVSIFGSARIKEDHEYYALAEEVAYKITQMGFGIITGGGPGIMEAANKGAKRGGGQSVGLGIDVFHENGLNPYIDTQFAKNFDYFFARKVMFVKYAQGFVVMPGGLGTLDELFEALTLIQTHKTTRFPIILFGTKFWNGLLDWLKAQLLDGGYISESDLQLFRVVDTADEAVAHIKAFYDKYAVRQNF